jgi:predicted sugar kinase
MLRVQPEDLGPIQPLGRGEVDAKRESSAASRSVRRLVAAIRVILGCDSIPSSQAPTAYGETPRLSRASVSQRARQARLGTARSGQVFHSG